MDAARSKQSFDIRVTQEIGNRHVVINLNAHQNKFIPMIEGQINQKELSIWLLKLLYT